METFSVDGLLRGLAWARLGLAALLFALGPLLSSGFVQGEHQMLALALVVVVVSSGALLVLGSPAHACRVAWLICLLDATVITAVVAATGGATSIFPFLYVLLVSGACVLLSKTGGLVIAGVSSLLYAGVALALTVLPSSFFLDAPHDTTALELSTIFLNAGTFLTVAIVAGGLAERFRSTRAQLESRQRDLLDLEAFKDLVFESVSTGLIALDRQHRVTAWNAAAAEIMGTPSAAALGRPWTSLFGDFVDLEEIAREIDGGRRTSGTHEALLPRLDGCGVSLRVSFSALRAGDGERIGLIAACEDMSEIRAMEERVRQADRLATLGRMAAHIAHELRNPLASLTGAIEVLSGPSTVAEVRDRLSQIVLRESERLNQIIRNFLEYARPAPLVFETVDIADTAEDVLVLLEHRPLPEGLKIVREFAPPVPWRVDPQQFRQLLWNLCLNAIEAMPAGGELHLGLAVRPRALEVWVTDTGEGLSKADLAQIFEPFYSTKAGGTGLGLALVHRIVRDHAGTIDVRSTPGLGTTFVLTLPSYDG